MSGRRHHILPRFLMKGFATHKKKNFYSYVTEKNKKEPCHRNINNINVEKDFYRIKGSNVPDDLVTDLENSLLSNFAEELRKINKTQAIDAKQSAVFFSHIMIRTKSLRESLLSLIDKFPQCIKNQFLDHQNCRKFIIENLNNWLVGIPESTKREIITAIEQMSDAALGDMLIEGFDRLFPYFTKTTPLQIEDTFEKVYSSSPVPEERAKKYETYSWSIYYDIDANYILSDSACVVIKKNGDVSFFDDAPEEMKALVLPISSQHLLIGTKDGSNLEYVKEINEKSASCSFNYFISKDIPQNINSLKNLIGNNNDLVDLNEIKLFD